MASSDMHEFRPINDGKTALMTIYQQRQFDMTPWNVKTGVGWLMESVFQEIDVETNDVLFEWRSLDHVDPSSSYTWPAHTDTSGTGLNVHEPWDYFHINSVDKNAAGDYLISSRHTSAIYKVSGKDGSVMWRLHGAQPSFRNINFSFSQQHDARWLYENATHTLLSLYNNGYNGFNKTHTYSAGMIIMIDHVEKTATQLRDYAPIRDDLVSSSQGNLQMLPNQNAFIGWGNNPFVSEHDEAGNLLFWGSFAKDTVMNYRAMKFEWDGAPTDSPALWTYSRSAETSSTTSFYVSWNGATRVQTWRFWGAMNATGPWTLLDEVSKTGFETKYSTPKFYLWSKVEAVDREGILLGKSETKYTFVPSSELREFCAESTCLDAPGYGFPGEEAARPFIPPVGVNTVPWIDPNNPGSNIYTHPSGYAGPAGTPKYSDRWRNGRKYILNMLSILPGRQAKLTFSQAYLPGVPFSSWRSPSSPESSSHIDIIPDIRSPSCGIRNRLRLWTVRLSGNTRLCKPPTSAGGIGVDGSERTKQLPISRSLSGVYTAIGVNESGSNSDSSFLYLYFLLLFCVLDAS